MIIAEQIKIKIWNKKVIVAPLDAGNFINYGFNLKKSFKGGASLNRGLWKVVLTISLPAIFILTYT